MNNYLKYLLLLMTIIFFFGLLWRHLLTIYRLSNQMSDDIVDSFNFCFYDQEDAVEAQKFLNAFVRR